jgi:diguanylate cyclase (GGDEF)-like protein
VKTPTSGIHTADASPGLTETIASTRTIQLAAMPESKYFCTPIEERFERITRVARRAVRVPVAAVTLVNDSCQWFKSSCGWPISKLPLEDSLCRFTIAAGEPLAIPDTVADSRTADSPLVARTPKFRAYAGHPILDEQGIIAGTFCVFDIKPRPFPAEDLEAIADLAAMAQQELVGEHVRGAHDEIVSKLGIARREAMVDPLTRLWNRRGTMVMLDAAIRESRSINSPLVIALIDLDNFKQTNDTHGHQIGDEVLRKCAARLIRSVRMSDIVGRIGGDEFMLILTEADRQTAVQVLERLRQRVADAPIVTRHAAVHSTISVGYTLLDPSESVDAESLLDRADRALLGAKHAGRDRVEASR